MRVVLDSVGEISALPMPAVQPGLVPCSTAGLGWALGLLCLAAAGDFGTSGPVCCRQSRQSQGMAQSAGCGTGASLLGAAAWGGRAPEMCQGGLWGLCWALHLPHPAALGCRRWAGEAVPKTVPNHPQICPHSCPHSCPQIYPRAVPISIPISVPHPAGPGCVRVFISTRGPSDVCEVLCGAVFAGSGCCSGSAFEVFATLQISF